MWNLARDYQVGMVVDTLRDLGLVSGKLAVLTAPLTGQCRIARVRALDPPPPLVSQPSSASSTPPLSPESLLRDPPNVPDTSASGEWLPAAPSGQYQDATGTNVT
eukprot:8086143-Pyramimonas_sp.AAC.1